MVVLLRLCLKLLLLHCPNYLSLPSGRDVENKPTGAKGSWITLWAPVCIKEEYMCQTCCVHSSISATSASALKEFKFLTGMVCLMFNSTASDLREDKYLLMKWNNFQIWTICNFISFGGSLDSCKTVCIVQVERWWTAVNSTAKE